MAHFEKRLSSETKFEGRVITVTLDRVELENGGTSTREVAVSYTHLRPHPAENTERSQNMLFCRAIGPAPAG